MPIEHHEMDCRCGCGLNNVNDELLKLLNDAQAAASEAVGYYIPFKINSGCRCAANNEAAGGSATSPHLSGHAADIAIRTSRERLALVNAFQSLGCSRLGVGKNFLHVDNHPSKSPRVMWTY